MLTEFRKRVYLRVIMDTEKEIRANGVPVREQARQWVKLAYFQGKIGDQTQQKTALNKALELDPGNCWAKKLQAEITK